MPAKSAAQQKAAGAALSAKRGDASEEPAQGRLKMGHRHGRSIRGAQESDYSGGIAERHLPTRRRFIATNIKDWPIRCDFLRLRQEIFMKYSLLAAVLVVPGAKSLDGRQPIIQQQFEAALDALQPALGRRRCVSSRRSRRGSPTGRASRSSASARRPPCSISSARTRQPRRCASALLELPADTSRCSRSVRRASDACRDCRAWRSDYPTAHRLYLEAKAIPVPPDPARCPPAALIQALEVDDPPPGLALADEGRSPTAQQCWGRGRRSCGQCAAASCSTSTWSATSSSRPRSRAWAA